ncbi:uncharacterized protein LOC110019519 isoform X1 [Phalaenopsis equestris]|uniref:uncharacterized protein LOC110019519 isoform X1 n=1 Tax=Phalaenopsis equestris TaxID=78828 RepID=UPI0009E55BE9|nr:uncharacterized protein LOC110019519 isoform X1 [Phalaenopsis equestris]
MGNCAFAGGDGPSSPTIKVVTPDGGVMELDAPVTAELITAAFPGYAIFPNRDLSSSPLLHTDNLAAGELYNLLPLTTRAASITLLPSVTAPYRVSFDRHAALFSRRLKTEAYSPAMAAGVWKVKLAISRAELAEILGEETRTEALIESVRAMTMCAAGGSSGSTATASDLQSFSSSRKTSSENLGFSCSAGRFRRRMWGPDSDVED